MRVGPWLVTACLLLGCGEGRDAAEPQHEAAKPTAEQPADAAERRPNLVLITLDTLRADALGAYGQARPTSPNIDQLAETGVIFDQAVTSSPETLPSHSTIFTGMQPYAHGVRANAGYALSEHNVTLAEVLKSHGYRTGAEVASAVLAEDTQISQGFEQRRDVSSPGVEWIENPFDKGQEESGGATHSIRIGSDITRHGIEFIRRHHDEPFFLWLHYFDVHNPYRAPEQFNAAIPDSPYHAGVAFVDHEVGRVIAAIEELGLRENTLVALTSDHGEGLEEHGEATHSFFVYDTTMRVPLIFWGLDGQLVNRRVDSLVRTVDIAPTVLDLFGLPSLSGAQGVSLRPQLSGRDGPSLSGYGESSWRFLGTFGIPPLRFVREGRWKYIHKVNPELYDVVADPGELMNRIADEPEIAKRLRARLEAEIRDAPDAPADSQTAVDSDTAAQLAALGYVTSEQVAEVGSELELLELSGEDPLAKVSDIRLVAVVGARMKRKDYAKAVGDLELLAERNPDSRFVLGLLAEALLGLDRNDDVIPVYRHLHELEVAEPNQLAKLASLLVERGERDEAIRLLREVLREEPCHEGALSDVNLSLRGEGRYSELVDALAEGARACPELATNLNNYAWALATLPSDDLRDGAKAVELARAALAVLGNGDPGTRDTLAAALAESGDFAQAVKVQSEVVEQLKSAGVPEATVALFADHLTAFRDGRPLRDPESPGAR